MSNVVFILGAGASAASGAPVMRNFLDVARDLLATGRVEGHRCHFETVFRIIGSLQQVHSKAQLDLTNIESIFTVLELARIIKRIPGVAGESEIDAAISALKVLIVKTLEMSITYPFREHSRQPLPPEPYPNFADLIRDMRDSVKVKRSASVITFNYDVSIDMAMFQAELGPSYGIFDAPRIAKGQQIPLLKLHGSLNWAISEPDRVIHPLHMIDLIPKISGLGLGPITFNIGSDIQAWAKVYGLKESLLKEPLIVPPSWNKADYHTALSGIWESAATHLSEAEYIFIAGYSLPETDSFFRHLFALGSTGKNPFRKIVVYDPNESINDRFRTMLGPGALATYEFKKLLFSEAISDVRQILNVPYPRS